MTWTALQRFFLENHKEIDTLLELKERARREIPARMRAGIRGAIAASISEWRGFGVDAVVETQQDRDGMGVWWADAKFFNHEKDSGFYHGMFGLDAEELFPDESGLGKVHLALFATSRISKNHRTVVRDAIEKSTKKLMHNGIRPGRPKLEGWDDTCLAHRDISNLVEIDDLKDWSNWIGKVVLAARSFSEATTGMLPQLCGEA